MEKTKILTANFLDILFDGRNKEYGAYELRVTYSKRMWQAITVTFLLFLLIFAGAYLKNSYAKKNNEIVKISGEVSITAIPDEPEKESPPPPPPPIENVPPPPQVQTIKLTTPIIVDNDKVVEPPPTQDQLAEARISNITQEGVKENFIAMPPAQIDGNRGIIPVIKKPEPEMDIIEKEVTTEASYLGGAAAWRTFLERNLRGEVPVENGAEPKNYTVIIQFVVDKDGSISDIKPLTKLGYGMEDEAIRVIKKSGKWRPAVKSGKEVKAYRKQPITFQILEQ